MSQQQQQQQLPTINVLIANHNYQDLVIKSINSALLQSYPNISITVVDDGSTDDSVSDIYETFFKHVPHNKFEFKCYPGKTTVHGNRELNLIQIPSQHGPSFARNIGIEFGIDRFYGFAILDADDEMYSNKVGTLLRPMMQVPSLVGAVYADYDVLNVSTGFTIREHKETFSKERLLKSCIVHSGSLIASKALKKVKDRFGYYDSEMRVAEDWDLWLRIAKQHMIVHVPESLTLVRATPKDSTNSVDKQVWRSCWDRINKKLGGEIR